MPVIKRYSNRKLYDTESKRYVTLEEVAAFIRQGDEIKVIDHETGKDLTYLTLVQIVFEEEKKIGELMPQVVLTRLLRTGSETLEVLRSRMLAAFDPESQVTDEIRRRIDHLIQQGEIDAELGKSLVEKLTVSRVLDDIFHSPSSPEASGEPPASSSFEMLQKQVEELEQELHRLKEQN